MPSTLLTEDGRVCRGCGHPKAWVEFGFHKCGLNGRSSRCKSCERARTTAYATSSHGRSVHAKLQRGYRKRHPERVKQSVAKWIAAHPTYERDRSRRRYAKDPRKFLNASRRWMDRNPARMEAARRKRRAAMEGATPPEGGVTAEQWGEVLALYEGRCAYCFDVTAKPHMDHIIPLDRDGLHIKGNVAPACAWCNLSKGPRLLRTWLWPERMAR